MKSTKTHLKRVRGDVKLSFEELTTILTSGVARRMIEMWHIGCAREKIVRGFRGLSGVGTREITKERLLRHGSVAISARGKIFFSFLRCGLGHLWPPPGYASDSNSD